MDLAAVLFGIRTAARRKKSKPPRVPIASFLVQAAAKTTHKMFPQVQELHLVGSRLRHKYGRDLEFVAVVEDEADMPARNMVDALKTDGFDVDLFFSLPDEVEMHILEFGLGFDIMRWKRAAMAKGYHMNRYGLWRGKHLVTQKMAEVAKLLGMPLKPFLVATLNNPL